MTRAQRSRLFGLLRPAGDVWCCVLELARWRYSRRDVPLAGYQELCRELTLSGPGTFGELDTTGARSVLRRYSDAWFATAKRRQAGDSSARYPRRRRGLAPVRWYAGTFTLTGRVLRLPVARGCPPLTVRLDRDVPYPDGQVRSVTLGFDAGRLYLDVTAEVRVATYPEGTGPDPGRLAGVDLGIIDPSAAAPGGEQLLVSGRTIRAECRPHLRDRKGRSRASAPRAPKRGQRVPKPAGRNFTCPHCGHTGHRDLIAAANIAARNGGGTIPPPATAGAGITHRRAGKHLPGVHPARRDPRRRPPSRAAPRGQLAGTGPPQPATSRTGSRSPTRE